MRSEWFKPLLQKLYDSYSARIILVDSDKFSSCPDVRRAMETDFNVHFYKSELELRAFLRKNKSGKSIIVKLPEVPYIPFDIEERSEIITWKKTDLHMGSSTARQEMYSSENDKYVSELHRTSITITKLLTETPVPWGKVSQSWGYYSYLKEQLAYATVYNDAHAAANIENTYLELDKKLEEQFKAFIQNQQYRNLFFQTPLQNPVTVNNVLPFLNMQRAKKIALICMDGMGFQEWFCLKKHLSQIGINTFQESFVFALLPTVTSISRRALFSGRKKINDLPPEKQGFLDYFKTKTAWNEQDQVLYFLEKEPIFKEEFFQGNYVGIVFGLIDELAHHTICLKNDKALMQQNLEILLLETDLDKIIQRFLEAQYRVFITSDHGTVWSYGIGVKQDKYLVDSKAKRACLFNNRHLAADFADRYNDLYLFEYEELLGEKCAVFAPWRGMFGNEKERKITHGGIHLEEVVVPFVEVLR